MLDHHDPLLGKLLQSRVGLALRGLQILGRPVRVDDLDRIPRRSRNFERAGLPERIHGLRVLRSAAVKLPQALQQSGPVAGFARRIRLLGGLVQHALQRRDGLVVLPSDSSRLICSNCSSMSSGSIALALSSASCALA